jgi:hypothetical protein
MIIPGKESTFIGDVAKLEIATRTLDSFHADCLYTGRVFILS